MMPPVEMPRWNICASCLHITNLFCSFLKIIFKAFQSSFSSLLSTTFSDLHFFDIPIPHSISFKINGKTPLEVFFLNWFYDFRWLHNSLLKTITFQVVLQLFENNCCSECDICIDFDTKKYMNIFMKKSIRI